VYNFSDSEIKKQLKFFLIVALLQSPLTIYQRFVQFRHHPSGDFIAGTINFTGILSIYQICTIAILTAFYLKKKIKLFHYLLLSLIIFIPTTLNETKATFIIFPIAIFTTVFFATETISKLKKYFIIFATGFMIVVVFIPTYNYLMSRQKHDRDIVEFFTTRGHGSVRWYLFRNVSEDPESVKEIGRLDALLFPFKKLSKDPFKLLMGLGIGNVNPSFIKDFSGEYTEYQRFRSGSIAAAALIWEVGLLGLTFYLVFFGMVFKDALYLRTSNGVFGVISLGWISVTIIICCSLLYTGILTNKVIGYLFWYFSGIIASKRVIYDKFV
jgi:hypothetical protein